jgi:hypothetical protein
LGYIQNAEEREVQELTVVMQLCWAQLPSLRPTSERVVDLLMNRQLGSLIWEQQQQQGEHAQITSGFSQQNIEELMLKYIEENYQVDPTELQDAENDLQVNLGNRPRSDSDNWE